jgi:hypothetical protein
MREAPHLRLVSTASEASGQAVPGFDARKELAELQFFGVSPFPLTSGGFGFTTHTCLSDPIQREGIRRAAALADRGPAYVRAVGALLRPQASSAAPCAEAGRLKVEDLPFVRSKGKGRGFDYWAVKSTGNYTDDYALGKSYAEAFLSLELTYGNVNALLGPIVLDIAQKKRPARGIVLGFMGVISKSAFVGRSL